MLKMNIPLSNILPGVYAFDVELPRKLISQAIYVHEHGKTLFDLCKSNWLRILNRRCGVDSNIGKFTFVSTQGCSVVDYVLCKPTFFKHVNTFEVQDPNILSDHCAITFSINAVVDDENAFVVENNEKCVPYKYKWDSNKEDAYFYALSDENISRKFDELTETIELSNRWINEWELKIRVLK